MIISKTPFRVSLVGGGTDQSYYYKTSPGAVISIAINKYMYINLNRSFSDNYRIAYSKIEIVNSLNDIEHNLVRLALTLFDFKSKFEIVSIADVPSSGTGLGSSSAFAVGLLKILNKLAGIESNSHQLAELACKLEIELNKSPIGKQDQFAISYGGINQIIFNKDESVNVIPLHLDIDFEREFLSNMVLFYTNASRSTNTVLNKFLKNSESEKSLEFDELRDLALQLPDLIRKQKIEDIGKLVYENHLIKTGLNPYSNNSVFTDVISQALNMGAYGGKILGAGGGGFGLIIGPTRVLEGVKAKFNSIKFMNFGLDKSGSEVIYHDI
jgi:D-glycero-alpha-D-manno-heptose-7-phosphate kinase